MLQQSQQFLSIVVPCFNEEAVIEETHARMTRMAARLNELEYEIIYVDDGSQDGTAEILEQLQHSDPCVRVLRLSRNFGHQIAVTAGLEHAERECRGAHRCGSAGPARGDSANGGAVARGIRRGVRRARVARRRDAFQDRDRARVLSIDETPHRDTHPPQCRRLPGDGSTRGRGAARHAGVRPLRARTRRAGPAFGRSRFRIIGRRASPGRASIRSRRCCASPWMASSGFPSFLCER